MRPIDCLCAIVSLAARLHLASLYASFHEPRRPRRNRLVKPHPMRGSVGDTWRSLRQDVRSYLREIAPARRLPALVKRLLKYAIACVLYRTGLTGPLLRRTLESSQACLDRKSTRLNSSHL